MMKFNVRPPYRLWLTLSALLSCWSAAVGQTAEIQGGPQAGPATALQTESSSVKLWDISNGRVRDLLTGEGEVTCAAFSPDGRLLATADARLITLWDLNAGRRTKMLAGHKGAVQSLAFSPDGKLLASGGWDHKVKLWDLASGREIASLQGNAGEVLSVAFSPDGRYLAAGGGNEKVKVWDLRTNKLVYALQGHALRVNSVAFSPDGAVLATGSDDKTVKLWEVASGKLLSTLEGHTGAVKSVAFNPRNGRLASGAKDQSIRLWNALGGAEMFTLRGHFSEINSVTFSPDGTTLSSGSYDRTVKLWDANTGAELRTLEGHAQRVTSTAFSPDGRTLATVGAPMSETSTVHVLAVGISNYSAEGWSRFDLAAKDATDFAAALERTAGAKFARVNVRTLIDFAASKPRVSSTFTRLIAEVKPQDTFVFFFAGYARSEYDHHLGGDTYYMEMSDGQAITDVLLKSWLGKIEARRQLIILETKDMGKGYETLFKRMAREGVKLERLLGRDTFILANAFTGLPPPGVKNQFLTHSLLEGLGGAAAGGDGELTARSLFGYAKGKQAGLPKALRARVGELGSYEVGEDIQLGAVPKAPPRTEHRPDSPGAPSALRLNGVAFLPALANQGPPFVRAGVRDLKTTRPPARDDASVRGPRHLQQFGAREAGAGSKPSGKLTRKGKDYALLIATDSYHNWEPLKNPVADAKAVAGELKKYYGFETEVIENPTKEQVIDALVRYHERRPGPDDQLFVFFAGHGSFLPLTNTGYLVFRDSRFNDKVGDTYLSYDILSRVLDGFAFRHIYLVIDACYGGMFGEAIARRGGEEDDLRHEIIERKMQFVTRQYLTSGGKQYVPDGRPGHHSPFSRGLLEAFRDYGGRDGYVNVKKILLYVDGINPIPHSGGWGKNEPGSDFFFITRTP